MVRKVKIAATEEDFEQASKEQGDFVLPPNGYYILTSESIEPGFSKDDDGNEDKSKPYLECIYKITGVGPDDEEPTENYGQVWDYVSFSKDSGWARARFLKAFGYADGSFEGSIDLDEAIGQKVLVRLRQQRARKSKGVEYPAKVRIASLLPYADRSMAEAFGGVTEGSTEEGPFGAAAAPEGGEPEAYTEEELAGMELKELGKIAREEFELNPDDSVVTVRGKVNTDKTMAKIIEAILAAQEAEGGDDEGASESPF